jgi:coenzyme F420-0:L-glutamate ligase/coenzyme F420-1:gamma-L-glutamate ligase
MSEIRIIPIQGIGEVTPNSDIASLIIAQLSAPLENHDIVVVTQKIVSKAEGRIVDLHSIEPSEFAKEIAKTAHKKDPAYIEVVLQQAKRVVRMDHGVILTETHQGFICANSGVDESNVGNQHLVTLLPEDPDKSAQNIQQQLQNHFGLEQLAVIITDTWGRPWREGQVNFALGVAGMDPIEDYRNQHDTYGYTMHATMIAVADEIAGAAELVMKKLEQVPVAVIRGYNYQSSSMDGKKLVRTAGTDMFR